MVNTVLLERILSDIKANIADLKNEQNLSWDEYLADKKSRRFIERTMHITIEAMLDIAQHIISDEKLREPDSYRDTFRVLAENKILDSDSVKIFEKMAAFRNLIVHYYERVDDEVIFGILKNNLGDFELYYQKIRDWLKQLKDKDSTTKLT